MNQLNLQSRELICRELRHSCQVPLGKYERTRLNSHPLTYILERYLIPPPGLLSRKEGKEHVGGNTEDIYEDFREASDVLKHGGQRISSILKLPSRISSDS